MADQCVLVFKKIHAKAVNSHFACSDSDNDKNIYIYGTLMEKKINHRDKSSEQFPLELFEESDIPEKLDAAIRKLLCESFPSDATVFSKTRYWHGVIPAYTLIYRKDGKVAGHIGVVVRQISIGAIPATIAGIQNLAVSRESRGSGLSRQLMTMAMHEAARRNIKYCLLFCVQGLEKFYNSQGWKTTLRQTTMRDPNGNPLSLPPKNITMFKELGEGNFPEGSIDLNGSDW